MTFIWHKFEEKMQQMRGEICFQISQLMSGFLYSYFILFYFLLVFFVYIFLVSCPSLLHILSVPFFYFLCATLGGRGVYEISVIFRTDRPMTDRPTDDRPLFLEELSWKNFKRPYLHNGAR